MKEGNKKLSEWTASCLIVKCIEYTKYRCAVNQSNTAIAEIVIMMLKILLFHYLLFLTRRTCTFVIISINIDLIYKMIKDILEPDVKEENSNIIIYSVSNKTCKKHIWILWYLINGLLSLLHWKAKVSLWQCGQDTTSVVFNE